MEKKTLSQLNQESIEFFHELTVIGDEAKSSFEYIIQTFNEALPQQDIEALTKLIPFIEEGQGYSAYKCIGKTCRLLRILYVINLEYKYNLPLFIQGCSNVDSLMEKYMTTVFALRRLSFCISEGSIYEAIACLQSQPLSYLSIQTFTEGECIVTNDFFYELILYAFDSLWSTNDKNNFLALIQSNNLSESE